MSQINKMNSLLEEVTQNDLFKLFKVNIIRECTVWEFAAKCRMNQCPIDEEQKLGNNTHYKTFLVDKTLTRKDEEFTNHIPIEEYSDAHNGEQWIVDELMDDEGIYVDLLKNPEKFSGYNGSNIWFELYENNLKTLKFPNKGPHERFLFKIISGLQSSINMHISRYYLDDLENVEDVEQANFYHNYQIYYDRIGKYPTRIRNLYYLYVYVLHTIDILSPLLPKYTYDTESQHKNLVLQNRMVWFGHYINGLLDPELIESDLYLNITKPEFVGIIKPKFENITDLLDCIGCNICKLNAKVQFTGLAAMFKVIFTLDDKALITENELTGLINLVHRLSNSIKWYREYREYEDKDAFIKTIIFACLIALAIIMFIIAVILCFIKSKPKTDEDVPLRNPGQQQS